MAHSLLCLTSAHACTEVVTCRHKTCRSGPNKGSTKHIHTQKEKKITSTLQKAEFAVPHVSLRNAPKNVSYIVIIIIIIAIKIKIHID